MCMEYNEQSVCPHCKHTQRDEDQKKLEFKGSFFLS